METSLYKKNMQHSTNNPNPLRILIWNRGEIAIRIAQGILQCNHYPIGVYTKEEPNAFHLHWCKEWIPLEGTTHLETFLNLDQLEKIIRKHKIQALHPGYGFLSENPKLAILMESLNCIFIGPNIYALEIMGDKARSKRKAKELGVPVIPGSLNPLQSLEEAKTLALEIGFPVMLKATAGGGGKGMRICQNLEEIEAAYSATKREALNSFGNDDLLMEKFIENPHHIEVQILAHPIGPIVHLYERECSIQRRNQKIIEETPSPFIGEDENLREEITQCAVMLANGVQYQSAGTIEFVMGYDSKTKKKKFYFLEMNTRIQVEHPITEEITGLDIMSLMIKGALNQSWSSYFNSQKDIKRFGHAIECRICVEDPITYLPAPGKVQHFDFFPNFRTRFDHCIYQGLNISPSFDPMIGKLICWRTNRTLAIEAMSNALENQLVLEGIKTNISLHKSILKNEVFIKGDTPTSFLKSQFSTPNFPLESSYSKSLESFILGQYLSCKESSNEI